MRTGFLFFLAVTSVLVAPARASETIAYTYDAQGQLLTVARSGTVNSGVQASYTYDLAGNRMAATVTGSSGTPPIAAVAVVPLLGKKTIPIPYDDIFP